MTIHRRRRREEILRLRVADGGSFWEAEGEGGVGRSAPLAFHEGIFPFSPLLDGPA